MLAALACFCVAATSCPQTDLRKETPGSSVSGRVIEATSGQAIQQAIVELIGGDAHAVGKRSAITNEEGKFVIEGVAPARYQLSIEKSGFVRTRGGGYRGTIAVLPGQSLRDVVVRMQAAGVIFGKVLDDEDDPMVGADVTAMIEEKSAHLPAAGQFERASTDEHGEFRLPDLRPGHYLVWATAPANAPLPEGNNRSAERGRLIYVSTYYPDTLNKSQAIPLSVRSGRQVKANIRLQTSRAYYVSGIVVGAPSGPLTQLLLSSADGGRIAGSMRLGTRGKFELEDVLPDKYTARLLLVSGIAGGHEEKPEVRVRLLAPEIDVSDSDIVGVQLGLERVSQIRGKLRCEPGKEMDWSQWKVLLMPTPGDEVNSRRVAGGEGTVESVAVQSDGTFAIKDAIAGAYQLEVHARSESLRDYYTKAVLHGGKDVADSGFTASGTVNLEVVLSENGASIEGVVTDEAGQPAAYATVVAVPSRDGPARPDAFARLSTDEKGAFRLRGMCPGKYTVMAFEELTGDYWKPEFRGLYGKRGMQVKLDEGAHNSMNLKLIPAEGNAP